MKVNQDWTYRSPTMTVDYKAGDELHAVAIEAAKAAGVTDSEKENADGDGAAKASAKGNTVSLKG